MPRKARTISAKLAAELGVAERFPLSEHSQGYIINRGGIAYVRWRDHWHSTGRSFPTEKDVRGRRRLDAIGNGVVDEWKGRRKGLVLASGETADEMDEKLERITIGQAVNLFTESALADTSYGQEKSWERAFKALAGYEAEQLTHARLQQLLLAHRDAQMAAGISPITIAGDFSRLGKFCTWCVNQLWITGNPVKLLQLPELEKKRSAEVYTPEQIDAACRATMKIEKDHPEYLALFIRLASWLGARLGELIALRWDKIRVDPKRGDHILIDDTYRPPHKRVRSSGRQMKGTKGGKGGFREFPLRSFPEVRTILDQLRSLPPHKRTNYIFPWAEGARYSSTIRKIFLSIGVDPGVRPIHKLRATAEQQWLDAGIALQHLPDLAGHTLTIINKNYRSRPSPAQMDQRINRP